LQVVDGCRLVGISCRLLGHEDAVGGVFESEAAQLYAGAFESEEDGMAAGDCLLDVDGDIAPFGGYVFGASPDELAVGDGVCIDEDARPAAVAFGSYDDAVSIEGASEVDVSESEV